MDEKKNQTSYNDIVITSIDVRRMGNGRVEFDSSIEGDRDDSTAVFLENVRDTGRMKTTGPFWNRKKFPILEGDELSLEDVKNRMLPSSGGHDIHPLLCIHGTNVGPETHIALCNDANKIYTESGGKKVKIIPVIWPAVNSIVGYGEDRRENSVGGRAFKALAEFSAEFPTKSLMAHSLGNRVLRYFADPSFKFDNFFLVGADIDHRVFNQSYIESSSDEANRCKDGLRIKSMLRNESGKIYVLHNKNDRALFLSNARVFFTSKRLGVDGVKESDLHSEFKGKNIIENKDMTGVRTKDPANHNYHFLREAVQFYDESILKYERSLGGGGGEANL